MFQGLEYSESLSVVFSIHVIITLMWICVKKNVCPVAILLVTHLVCVCVCVCVRACAHARLFACFGLGLENSNAKTDSPLWFQNICKQILLQPAD